MCSSFFSNEIPDAGWRTIEGVVVGDKVGEDEADEEADELNGRAGMMMMIIMMCSAKFDRR